MQVPHRVARRHCTGQQDRFSNFVIDDVIAEGFNRACDGLVEVISADVARVGFQYPAEHIVRDMPELGSRVGQAKFGFSGLAGFGCYCL